MYTDKTIGFGAFLSPIHAPDEDPTLALHRDVDLAVHLDTLGFDEVWMGEHHSTGWEYVGSPEVFLAYAAAKTHRIKLGTGVISLPYHHPYQVAERLMLLDHLSHGRLIFGAGPGALPYDALQFGLEVGDLRPRMEESLDVIIRLLAGERVTAKTAWFELNDAQIQLRPRTPGGFEVAVSGTTSPSGPKLAARHGTSLLTLNATQVAGSNALRDTWDVMEDFSQQFGTVPDRSRWRLVGPMHLAETVEEARRDVQIGLPKWIYYNTKVGTLGLVPESATTADDYIDALNGAAFAVIGTPDMAIAQLEQLWDMSGGFGTFLHWAHDWANPGATKRSYELFARYVAPVFRDRIAHLQAAQRHAQALRPVMAPKAVQVRKDLSDAYARDKAARQGQSGPR